MEGYDVVTYDDDKVGTVAGESGEYLIVEHGLIRKSKRALPRQFAHLDDEAQQVRTTIGKDIFFDSPEVDGEVDERAVQEHYGLTPSEGPGTERSSEAQGLRHGVEPAEEERARIRAGEPEIEESPALLGDRMDGVEEQIREER
jgi:hypothetical protein